VVPYDPSEIDFVVAYVLPCDAWFVIPVEAIAGRKTAKLCLHGNPKREAGEVFGSLGIDEYAVAGERLRLTADC
jgi:hypothetical protein